MSHNATLAGAPSRGTVVRVQGIPGPDIESAILDLRRTIDEHQNQSADSRPYNVTVVPSCVHEGELAALVDFPHGLPDFLSKIRDNPLSSWETVLAIKDEDVSFDRHFLGFTQLYTPDTSEDIAADIIAICGIDGHAYGSWQGRGSMRRMWLRHFLSRDLPRCRTMIYGYDAKLARRAFSGLEDYARGFLEDVKRVRNGKAEKRPLIFITHSFGGIILARALIKATQPSEADHPAIANLHKSTYGIVFFAVPHRGLDVEDMSRIMAEELHPRMDLLQQINVDSKQLTAQLEEFQGLLYDRKVVSFYEMEQSRRLEKNSTGQWSRSGEYFTSLEADRAILHMPKQIETRIPMQCDHSTIVKFDNRHDPGYINAIANLKEFVKVAPTIVAQRYATTSPGTLSISKPLARTSTAESPMIPIKATVDYSLHFDLGGIAEVSHFVGRRSEFSKIDEAFARKQHARQTVVLHGLGGIGKTQIAANYAKEHQNNYSSVFWFNCVDERSLHQSFASGARRILAKFPMTEGMQEAMDALIPTLIVAAVQKWLELVQNNRWLLVLDNVDNPDIPGVLKGAYNIRNYFPTGRHGHIIITTRVTQLARIGVPISIKKLHDVNECIQILQSISGRDFSAEAKHLNRLMARLDGLPLAISTAGAYLGQVPDNIQEYLNDYEKSWLELQQNSPELIDYEDRTLHTTWDISLRHIQQRSIPAVNILKLWACLDSQDLWYELIQPIANRTTGWAKALVKTRISFNKELRILCDVGLVEPQKIKYEKPEDADLPEPSDPCKQEVTGYSMHRCVHDWVCGKISQPLDHTMLALALWCIGSNAPLGNDRESWLLQQRILGHADWWYKRNVDAGFSSYGSIDWDQLTSVGIFFCEKKRHDQAAHVLTYLFWRFKATEGMQGYRTLKVSNSLGTVYLEQDKLSDAYAMFLYVMTAFEEQFGPSDETTLDVLNNLAVLFSKRNLVSVAQEYFQRVLHGRLTLHGSNSSPAMLAMRNQAILLTKQGDLSGAEVLASRAVCYFEREEGSANLETIRSRLTLAHVFEHQGKWAQVTDILGKVHEDQEKIFGLGHEIALRTLVDLGFAYRKQLAFPEAERTLSQAVQRMEANLGADHPGTLDAVHKLGIVLRLQEKLDQAESMFLRAWHSRQRLLGPTDRDTLMSLYNLAVVEGLTGQMASAVQHFKFLLSNTSQLSAEDNSIIDSAREMLQAMQDG